MSGHRGEVDVFEIRLRRFEPGLWSAVAEDAHDRPPREKFRRDDGMRPRDVGQVGLSDHASPDASAKLFDCTQRLGLEHDLAAIDDRHARTELADVVDDVRRENDDTVLTK